MGFSIGYVNHPVPVIAGPSFLKEEIKVLIYNTIAFFSSLKKSTTPEVSDGGGELSK
jgi:hypothetical protein